MQGHPESPRLWEKHADAILQELGLTPTTHEPCLYSGTIAGNRVIFKRQVDDFPIAAPDEKTANIVLLNMIDDKLRIPLKRQGLLDMFNGINVTQTRNYVKIDCHTYIDKFCEKYLDTWLKKVPLTENRPTPLPTDATWIKKFNAAVGPSDPNEQSALATKMQIKYKVGVGELNCIHEHQTFSVKLRTSRTPLPRPETRQHPIRLSHNTTAYTFGALILDMNSQQAHYLLSTATAKISSSMTAHNTMLP
jgi:hypothetical protein